MVPGWRVDELWTGYENLLPDALDVLHRREPLRTRAWLRALVPFVACTFLRPPKCSGRHAARLRSAGYPDEMIDEFVDGNPARSFELQRLLALITVARWTILHATGMRRFIGNDLGVTVAPAQRRSGLGAAWIIPIDPRTAIALEPGADRTVGRHAEGAWWTHLPHLDIADDETAAVNACSASSAMPAGPNSPERGGPAGAIVS